MLWIELLPQQFTFGPITLQLSITVMKAEYELLPLVVYFVFHILAVNFCDAGTL